MVRITCQIIGKPPYGFRVNLTKDNALVISQVRRGGLAELAGLQEGDKLVSIDRVTCTNMASTISALGQARDSVTIIVDRDKVVDRNSSQVQESSTTYQVKQPIPSFKEQKFEFSLDYNKKSDDKQMYFPSPIIKKDLKSNKSFEETKISFPSPTQPTQMKQDLKSKKPFEETKISFPPPSQPAQKKMFTDSAFYNDNQHKYPTMEEQVQLARQVAMSVISPANSKSKGHKMFLKCKERATKYTTGPLEDDEEDADRMEMTFNPTEPSLKSAIFAPKLPTDHSKTKLDALSNEELQLLQLNERKTTHTNVSPQVCFNLADDLKNMKGRGGRLFAKRQAHSEKWVVGGNGEQDENLSEEGPKMAPVPRFVPKDVPPAQVLRSLNCSEIEDDDIKSNISPWNAAAKSGGCVEEAFMHLQNEEKRLKARSIHVLTGLNKGLH